MRYNVSSIILHPQQWYMCTKIFQLLKVFNDAINTLFDIYNKYLNNQINNLIYNEDNKLFLANK